MRRTGNLAVAAAACAVLVGVLLAQEQERKVHEGEVPKAALEALRKLADKAEIKELAEEIEHGAKFYEGSWTGPHGNVDVLVTESGDLVEIEEMMPSDKVPHAARSAAEKEAGPGAQLVCEKKTMVLYEIHYKKDGKGHEAVFTPDGRRYQDEGENEEQDEDEGEEP